MWMLDGAAPCGAIFMELPQELAALTQLLNAPA
jgi:hypothetical protein